MTRRERSVALAASILASLFVVDRLIYRPMRSHFQALEDRIAFQTGRLARGRRLLQNGGALRAAYGVRQKDADPGAVEGSNSLIRAIEASARAAGVRVKDLRAVNDQGKSTALVVSLEGAWEPLARFGFEISRSPLALRIDRAAVQSQSDTGLLFGRFTIRRPSPEVPVGSIKKAHS